MITDKVEVAQYFGAVRLMRITVTGVTAHKKATPLRWVFREASPYSPDLA